MSHSSDEDDDKPMPMPDSLTHIFAEGGLIEDYTKSPSERANANLSLFTKTSSKVESRMTSENLKENRLKKAEEVYKKLNIFNKISPNA